MTRAWDGQVLRVTYFIAGRVEQSAFESLWQAAVGEPPEIDEAKPRENTRRQAGLISDGLGLEVQTQSGRIDWFVGPWNLANEPPQDHFGPIEPALLELNRVLMPWFGRAGLGCTRLALGMVLMSRTENRTAGYNEIMKLEPTVHFDATGNVSDFMLQLNRPIKSENADMMLNRLIKWSVARIQTVGVSLSAQGGTLSAPSSERYYVRLELDLSTPATVSQAPLEPAIIVPIFKELQTMGIRIANEGIAG